MNRLIPFAAALALAACAPDQLATAKADLPVAAADLGALCRAAPAALTGTGDIAAGLNLARLGADATAAADRARAIQGKCVVVSVATQSLAAGGSLSSTAVALLSDPIARADLAGDLAWLLAKLATTA